MFRKPLAKISLAGKCRLLFGLAVLFILTAALTVPWLRMDSLVDGVNIAKAEQMGQMTLMVISNINWLGSDWDQAQRELHQLWPTLAKRADLPPETPALIPVEPQSETNPFLKDAFLIQSIEIFKAERQRAFTHRVEKGNAGGRTYRVAMAVRASDTDRPPGTLKGVISVVMPIQGADQLFLNGFVIVGAGLATGAFAVLVFYLITQKLILSPVRELRTVAEEVAKGDLDVRSEIATGDEYEELSDSFNDMLTHLKRTQDELRTINKSLDAKLGELAEINVSLYESNRLKSEFLANVSHELRTPLASIIGFAELLRDAMERFGGGQPTTDPARLRRYADNIHISGRMLLDIINDLLDLAKIEAGKMELHVTEFSLLDVCEALIDFTKPLADKRQLTVELQTDPDLPRLNSDAGKIRQILYNLLSNAIKFTAEQGLVRIALRRVDGDCISMSVEDNGPGIPSEKQQAIFEKFWQIDSSKTREHSGTGLGLAISRELATILGGTLTVISQPDKGATFVSVLPIQAPASVERRTIKLN